MAYKQSTLKDVQAVANWLSDPAHWCKKHLFETDLGVYTNKVQHARKTCLVGAFMRQCGVDTFADLDTRRRDAFFEALGLTWTSAARLNDYNGYTAVMDLLDTTLARLYAAEGKEYYN